MPAILPPTKLLPVAPDAIIMPNWLGRQFDDPIVQAQALLLQLVISPDPFDVPAGSVGAVPRGGIFNTDPRPGVQIQPGDVVTVTFRQS